MDVIITSARHSHETNVKESHFQLRSSQQQWEIDRLPHSLRFAFIVQCASRSLICIHHMKYEHWPMNGDRISHAVDRRPSPHHQSSWEHLNENSEPDCRQPISIECNINVGFDFLLLITDRRTKLQSNSWAMTRLQGPYTLHELKRQLERKPICIARALSSFNDGK